MLSRKDKNLIKGCLRRLFSRSALVLSFRNLHLDPINRGPRGGRLYICLCCGDSFPLNKIQVDHIEPVIAIDKTIDDYDLNALVSRIYVDINNLQLLCLDCHKKKTLIERKHRLEYKRRKK